VFTTHAGAVSDALVPALQIVLIDLLLGGDNAIVIAMACRGLPRELWRRAVWLGTALAIALRIALTAFAALMLNLPYVKLVGALLLVVIAVRLVVQQERNDSATDRAPAQPSLWSAITTIVVADTVMSLDNVLAVAAASRGSLLLLSFGLALSVPILIFGSLAVARALDRYPVLVLAGGALLGWVAGDMAVTDPAVQGWVEANIAWMSTACAPIVAAYVAIHGRAARLLRAPRQQAR